MHLTTHSPTRSPVSAAGESIPAVQTGAEAVQALRPLMGQVAWGTLALFAGILAGYGTVFYSVIAGHLPLLAGAAINVFLGYLVFTPLHDAAHGSIAGRSKKLRPLETAIGWLAGSLLWAPFPAFQPLHLRHHSHTNDPTEDPDHWMATRNPAMLIVRAFTIMVSYYYHFLARMDVQKRKKLPQLIVNVLAMLAIGVAAGFAWGPAVPLLLWYLPAVFALAILAVVFDWLPHRPHTSRERYRDTRIVLKPGLQTLLLGQNLHLVHHLYPTIPFYKYGVAYRRVAEFLEAKGAPIVR